MATWYAESNADRYNVQLKKNGSNLGNAVSVGAGTERYDFTSAIAAAGSGSYTFTVTAVGDGINYGSSAASAASGAYNIYRVSIAGMTGGNVTASLTTASAGTTVDLTITPNAGKRLKSESLKYNDGTADYPLYSTAFTMPAAGRDGERGI